MNRALFISFFIILLNPSINFPQLNFYKPLDLDTVSWSSNDFGGMWTFDNVPVNNFNKKYGFMPTDDWLMDVQKSALQFGGGCSAAFVSEDGLIMTNHHCGRNRLIDIQEEGEDLLKDGFYAESPGEERKVEGLYVDQLIFITDVTEEIKNYSNRGITDDEKVKFRNEMKDSLIIKYNKETGLLCKIVTLYHGGKYSLYGYKRFNDIRLVMAPDFQIAATGWDWDNFTYPRYELDFMFYRAYNEEGKPVKTENYFKWSRIGAESEEPIFVVGRPGRTNRLYSYAQLEYLRDYVYPQALVGYNAAYDAYFRYYEKYPEKENLLNRVMSWGNSRKSYAGRLAGLNDEYIMKKKNDFQNDLISEINSDTELRNKYGHVWNSIDSVLQKLKQLSAKRTILRFNRSLRPVYYDYAERIIEIAEQRKLPEEQRDEAYRNKDFNEIVKSIISEDIDYELNDEILKGSLKFLYYTADSLNPFNNYIDDYNDLDHAAAELKSKSKLSSKTGFQELSTKAFEEILNSADPFINYILWVKRLDAEITVKVKELSNSLSVFNELLGEAVYYVYGDSIPPDATSTLRISDGVIRGYEYNGTIAPGKTTFYGLWDRYESFGKKTYPWGLHERWKIPPDELDLSIDIGFASTNDIVGGNSGSSVININKEVVGLVHDGNIESLAGHTIFLEKNNRTVATDSQGLIEALKHVYKTEKLVQELLSGKIDN